MLLKRELARAHASLKLEEQRNAGCRSSTGQSNAEEYLKRGNEAVDEADAVRQAQGHADREAEHGPRAARADRRVRAG